MIKTHGQQSGDSVSRSLLLGVTPALASMDWDPQTVLFAVDGTVPMIRTVWQRPTQVACAGPTAADWLALPFQSRTFHAIVGDGCYTVFGGFDNIARFHDEISRIMVPGGLYCLRCFCRSVRVDDPLQLLADERLRDLQNPHLFRFLVAMALHGESRHGVSLGDAATLIEDNAALRERHAGAHDIAMALQFLRSWQTHNLRFSFPSPDEFEALAEPRFDIVARDIPTYPYGEHFPRYLLRARSL